MEQSTSQPPSATGVASGQMAYGASSYPPASVVVTGAPAVMGPSSPTQLSSPIPTSPAQLPSPRQLAYQQVQQFHLQQQQQQQLQVFWSKQMAEVEQTTDFKNHSLPLARIKKIMKADEDVRMISAEAPVVFAKACEIFILELTLRSWINTEENKRRTLQKNDIAAAITRTDIFDFLVDIVPRDEIKEEGLGMPRPSMPGALGASADALSYYYQVAPPGMIMGKPFDQPTLSAAALFGQQPPPPADCMPWQQQQVQEYQLLPPEQPEGT